MMPAELAELADALDSGSSAARLPGSSPGFRTFISDFQYSHCYCYVKQSYAGG